MHELTIATNILRAAEAELAREGGPGADLLHVRVGDLAGVDRESLRFCLLAAREGTVLADAEIRVERIPARLVCPGCGEVPAGDRFGLICPSCGGPVSGVEGGRELEVTLETAG